MVKEQVEGEAGNSKLSFGLVASEAAKGSAGYLVSWGRYPSGATWDGEDSEL